MPDRCIAESHLVTRGADATAGRRTRHFVSNWKVNFRDLTGVWLAGDTLRCIVTGKREWRS